MASAFSATRVRNFSRWSVAAGSTSSERNSATASTSSAAVGRSDMLDQVEELVLHLRRHPAEHGVLDAAVLSVQVPPALRQAARRPLHVPEHLPPEELRLRDLPTGQLCVALEVGPDVADPAEPLVVRAEAPGADDRPGDVFMRIRQVGELPVKDVLEPPFGDGDVPEPEVAVADDVRLRLRLVLAQPPEAVLDRRVRLADRVELIAEALEHVAWAEERHPLGRDRVNLRELLGELEIELRRRLPHDPPPDRLTLDQLHRERLVAAELAQVCDRVRDLDARALRRLQHLELLLERQRCRVNYAHGGASHEQGALVRLDRPGFLRRTAREEAHRRHPATERVLQFARPGGGAAQADWPPSTTRVWPVT